MQDRLEKLHSQIAKQPRIRLANLPTPLEEMRRLSEFLGGPRLWIKRDDLTGLAFGGNKERKMEFAMADALNKKADVVITTGPIQSNHARATAAAARKLGLRAVLVLRGRKPKEYDGNLLLDSLFGAEIRFVQVGWRQVGPKLEEVADDLKRRGHKPYVVPGGASYPVGAVAYVNAMIELMDQAKDADINIDYVVHAAGSGGTQAGLVLANKALKTRVKILGVGVEPADDWLVESTVEIANGCAKLLGLKEVVDKDDVTLVEDYVGEGYGVLTEEVRDTMKLVAQVEGILLDPVYTGKAMAGLIDMVKRRRFDKEDNVVFIHTGGTPALFAYKRGLKP